MIFRSLKFMFKIFFFIDFMLYSNFQKHRIFIICKPLSSEIKAWNISLYVYWIYIIFHFLKWVTKNIDLLHDFHIFWDVPVFGMNIKTVNKNVKKLTSFVFNNTFNLLQFYFLSVIFIIQQIVTHVQWA